MFTITICTDAGHKNLYGQSCAVWASYIRTPHKTIKVAGVIKQSCRGSSHAELYAIANALHIVGRECDLSKYRVIVYSDNLYALKNHRDGSLKKNSKPDFLEVYNKYICPYVRHAYSYEARHVKAHLPPSRWSASSARHYMQNWCDEEVHRIMKIAQGEIIEKQKKICVLERKGV